MYVLSSSVKPTFPSIISSKIYFPSASSPNDFQPKKVPTSRPSSRMCVVVCAAPLTAADPNLMDEVEKFALDNFVTLFLLWAKFKETFQVKLSFCTGVPFNKNSTPRFDIDPTFAIIEGYKKGGTGT